MMFLLNVIFTLFFVDEVEKSDKDTRGSSGTILTHSENGLDLVFVLDSSSSVKLNNFKLGLYFAKELVRFIGRNGTRY